jgi:(p)ppGpp synthase/HD superfamily hydrolase
LTLEDKQLIKKAYFISFLAHHNQKRDDGTPYLEHPIRIALISLLLPLNQ